MNYYNADGTINWPALKVFVDECLMLPSVAWQQRGATLYLEQIYTGGTFVELKPEVGGWILGWAIDRAEQGNPASGLYYREALTNLVLWAGDSVWGDRWVSAEMVPVDSPMPPSPSSAAELLYTY